MSDFLYIAEVRLVKEQLLRLRPARSPPNKRILTTQILNIGPSVRVRAIRIRKKPNTDP